MISVRRLVSLVRSDGDGLGTRVAALRSVRLLGSLDGMGSLR